MLFSNFDLTDINGNIVFEGANSIDDSFSLNLITSPSHQTTTVPVVIHTQDFTVAGSFKYDLEFSADGLNYESCDIRTINDVQGNNFAQFYKNVYENGSYKFRLKNLETEEYIYKTVEVSNIVFTQDNIPNWIDRCLSTNAVSTV